MKPTLSPSRMNGSSLTPAIPPSAPLFGADALKMQHQMRVNPLPMLNPTMLGQTLDQFEYGFLRQAVLLWEAMCKRDDTLVTVKPQLENEVASKPWGVFTIEGADETEAARHKAALNYFYDHMRATDAFDRNELGGLHKLIEQMMRADSFTYAAHHFVWKPQPGKMVEVQGGAPVPAITAELEFVPLWFFENVTGRLRFLKDGGFGINGEDLNWDGEWMVTTGRGLMFAASICYTFKRLSLQDWVNFNERYATPKVIVQTPAGKGSAEGEQARLIADSFNGDLSVVIYGSQMPGDKPPISLLGPAGSVSVEIFSGFIERQDRKMSSMFRGNDLSMMSRAGKGEKPTGASLQADEGDDMVKGCCRRIAGTCQEFIDRQVIRFCFGDDVEPLAYFGLPDMDTEDMESLRKSAGFLADRGAKVVTSEIADRLGIELATATEPVNPEDILQPIKLPTATGDTRAAAKSMTVNALDPAADLELFLGPHRAEFKKAFSDDLIPLRLALEQVVRAPNEELQTANARALHSQLPWLLEQINRQPRTAALLADLMEAALQRGVAQSAENRATD